MTVQPTRDDARDTGTLNQYAHLYDVDRLRQDIKTGEHGIGADGNEFGVVKVGAGLAIDAEGALSVDLSGALNALNYTFTDKFTVNLSDGVAYTAITYGDIAHKYVAGVESYEVYKANFTLNVPRDYTAGAVIGFSFTFSYNGSDVTVPKRSMVTVINNDTGAVIGNYLVTYTIGKGAKYVLTVPVTETIPAQTVISVIMNFI